MSFACSAVQTESHVGDDVAIRADARPYTLKVPTISDKAALQSMSADGFDHFSEFWMERGFSTSEHHVRDVHRFTCFCENAIEKFEREVFGARMVKRVFVAQAIAAMQVTDVGKLDDQARRTVVARAASVFQQCEIRGLHVIACVTAGNRGCIQRRRTNQCLPATRIRAPDARGRRARSDVFPRKACRNRPRGTCGSVAPWFRLARVRAYGFRAPA